MENLIGNPFYVYIANLMARLVKLTKFMIVAIALNVLAYIMHARNDYSLRLMVEKKNTLQSNKNDDEHLIKFVFNLQLEYGNEQIDRHSVVMGSDKKLSTDLKEELDVPDEYSACRGRFIPMLSQFGTLRDVHLGSIKAGQHRIELHKTESQPIPSAPYLAGLKVREFETGEIDQMLSVNFIESAQTEWKSRILFVPKSVGTLRFCVDYLKPNAVTIWDLFPIPHIDEYSDSQEDVTIFSTLDGNSRYLQVDLA